MKEWFEDNVFRFILGVLIITGIIVGLILGGMALGTITFRSHNTNPKTGVVYTGGIWSDTNEKCYGGNLILDNGYGLATIANAQECR